MVDRFKGGKVLSSFVPLMSLVSFRDCLQNGLRPEGRYWLQWLTELNSPSVVGRYEDAFATHFADFVAVKTRLKGEARERIHLACRWIPSTRCLQVFVRKY